MKNLIAIIGANWGDEGKGLFTDYFADQFKTGYVVRFNGTCQAGHCQTADTLILSSHGIKYLGGMVGNVTNSDTSYPLININNEVESTSLLFTEYNKQINRVILSNGITLKGTDNHKYYVWNRLSESLEWIRTIDLNPEHHQFIIPKAFNAYVGTTPIIHEIQSTNSSTIKLKVDQIDILFISRLCGLINGDGYFTKDNSCITIACHINQLDIVDDVLRHLQDMGLNPSTYHPKNSQNCVMLRVCSTELRTLLQEQLGVKITKQEYKQTPRFVLDGTKSIIREYIRGLMDSDGTVKFHKQNKNMSGQISISNISLKLLVELQQLLLLFGINSKLLANKSKRKGMKDSWTLAICSSDDILNYGKYIGFVSEYKTTKLNTLIEHKKLYSGINNRGYLLKILDRTKKEICKQLKLGNRYQSSIRTALVNNSTLVGFDNIKHVCSNYHVVDIQSVDIHFGIEQVYDVTMPQTHSYIANGVISHNTVQLDNGTRHIFSHFGSGTFCGLSTFLAEKFVVNPLIFEKEYNELIALGYTPKVIIHRNCMITTPYDMIINQILEISRDADRHGSCGLGFGETIERHEKYKHLSTTTDHLVTDIKEFLVKVISVLDIYLEIRKQHIPDVNNPTIKHLLSAYQNIELLWDYIRSCQFLLEHSTIVDDYSLLNTDNVIFEGAQGLMLDQNSENFPYVTRSNTGIKNVLEIVDQLENPTRLDVLYVSRYYVTKHGAGPFPNEMDFPDHLLDVDQTNKPNEFQGTLRYAPLDLDVLYNNISNDFNQGIDKPYSVNKFIALTWLDQLSNDDTILSNGITSSSCDIVEKVTLISDYMSFGPTRSTIKN